MPFGRWGITVPFSCVAAYVALALIIAPGMFPYIESNGYEVLIDHANATAGASVGHQGIQLIIPHTKHEFPYVDISFRAGYPLELVEQQAERLIEIYNREFLARRITLVVLPPVLAIFGVGFIVVMIRRAIPIRRGLRSNA